MSAVLAVVMMLGAMVGMGAKEASIQAEKDRAAAQELSISEEQAQDMKEINSILAPPATKVKKTQRKGNS